MNNTVELTAGKGRHQLVTLRTTRAKYCGMERGQRHKDTLTHTNGDKLLQHREDIWKIHQNILVLQQSINKLDMLTFNCS